MDANTAQVEMPKYRSHKEVWALKIADIEYTEPSAAGYDGSARIIPEEKGYGPVSVDRAYLAKHQPQTGGYYVVYADGYKSWSPAEAFDGGYTRI